MPIVTKDKTIYGRHEIVPRERKTQDKTNNSAEDAAQRAQEERESANERTHVMQILKEVFFFLVLLVGLGYYTYYRTDGLMLKSSSLMPTTTAEQYAAVALNNTETTHLSTFVAPKKQTVTALINTIDNIVNNTDTITQLTNHTNTTATPTPSIEQQEHQQDDDHITPDPLEFDELCQHVDYHALIGSRVSVTYKLFSPTTNTTLIDQTTPITFNLKSFAGAIEQGSASPLLHLAVVDMCLNQTKMLQIKSPQQQQQQQQFDFNQYFSTLFPTLVNYTRVANETTGKTQVVATTLLTAEQTPLELTVQLIQIETAQQLSLSLQAAEAEKLKNGDFTAFIRATFAKVHPFYLLVGYVGIRFGTSMSKRWIKQRRAKELEEKNNKKKDE